jgi:imidazolonepropionase-like amidohydrolase
MIITCDRVIYGDKHMAPEKKAVYIKDGKVACVAPEREMRERYPDEEITSFPGCSVMPGMIDMHVHLNAVPDLSYYQEENAVSLCALYTAGRMRHALEAGVTTLRDAYSPFGIGTALNRAAQDGHILSPRVIPCLRGICMIGGHGSDSTDGVTEICGAEEGRRAVRQNFKRGAKWIKVLTSDAYRGVELSQEELDAIVDEAHRLGMGAFAHAGYGSTVPI